MEISKENAACLTNYEVLNILREIKGNKHHKSSRLATVTYQTLRYLEKLPCKDYNHEKVTNFMKAVEHFNITKSEKLTLINLCPKTPVDIQLIVEDSEDRLSEEQVLELIQIVALHLDEPLEEVQEEDESMDH